MLVQMVRSVQSDRSNELKHKLLHGKVKSGIMFIYDCSDKINENIMTEFIGLYVLDKHTQHFATQNTY